MILLFLNVVNAAQSPINSSVGMYPNLLLSVMPTSSSYCPGDVVNITTNVTNAGNNQTVFLLNQSIYNQYNSLYSNQTWKNQQILPTQQRFYFLTKNVSDGDIAGIYNVYTDLVYFNNKTTYETNFRIKQRYGSLVSSPSFIEKTVFPGDFISEDLYLWLLFPCYGANVFLNTSGDVANWIYFSSNPVYLPPETWNYTRIGVFIDLPWNTIPRDYAGYIIASMQNEVTLYIPVTIHVQTIAIFDVQTEVISQHKEVCQGGDVTAKVNVLKVFPDQPIDVNMTYILEYAGNKYAERKETIAVGDTLEKFVTLRLPQNSPEGIYTFYSILDVSTANWAVNISSSDTFNVIPCQQPQPPPQPSGGGGGGQSYPLEEKKELYINVSRYKIPSLAGNLSSFIVSLTNTGTKNLTNIKLVIDGLPLEWLTLSPYKIDKINAGDKTDIIVFIKTPIDAKQGVYPFSVKAKNSVESNKENLLFIVSQDDEGLAKLLYQEAEKARKNASRTLMMKCIDLTELSQRFVETEKLMDVAIKNLESKEYKKSQELFVKIISDYESVNIKADVLMKERLLKIYPLKIFPFKSKVSEFQNQADYELEKKNYEEFCTSIDHLLKYNSYSLAEIVFLTIFAIIAAIVGYLRYRKFKEKKFEEKLENIKKRLGYQ